MKMKHKDFTELKQMSSSKDVLLIKAELRKVIKQRKQLSHALAFYADPDSYFAIGFLPDPPCGGFMKDFAKVQSPWDVSMGWRAGKLARKTLKKFYYEVLPPEALQELESGKWKVGY